MSINEIVEEDQQSKSLISDRVEPTYITNQLDFKVRLFGFLQTISLWTIGSGIYNNGRTKHSSYCAIGFTFIFIIGMSIYTYLHLSGFDDILSVVDFSEAYTKFTSDEFRISVPPDQHNDKLFDLQIELRGAKCKDIDFKI